MNECCGTCKYHRFTDGDWACTNDESEYVTDYTPYDHVCDEWEERTRK